MTAETLAAGTTVWTIFADSVVQQTVAEATDEYVRIKARGRQPWHPRKLVFTTKQEAAAALALRFRQRALSLIEAAEELEGERTAVSGVSK